MAPPRRDDRRLFALSIRGPAANGELRAVGQFDRNRRPLEDEIPGVRMAIYSQRSLSPCPTIDYMAPEQAFSTKTADARADIDSLGCTLWRLHTGRNLFDAETIMQKLIAHQTAPVPSLAAARPDASAELQTIFERMVAKQPQDRFQKMGEVETALAASGAAAPYEPGSASATRRANC